MEKMSKDKIEDKPCRMRFCGAFCILRFDLAIEFLLLRLALLDLSTRVQQITGELEERK